MVGCTWGDSPQLNAPYPLLGRWVARLNASSLKQIFNPGTTDFRKLTEAGTTAVVVRFVCPAAKLFVFINLAHPQKINLILPFCGSEFANLIIVVSRTSSAA